ncbi:hypothetical protein THAOC_17762 [Thalassiosira oceanica]|uniref:Uncharacterized protein n=1 Tax=Thalassiosira oceanica TaxID=159749 RepID=K0S6N9_THAOC|nr:hypothetical protein THAOC_17762 [Thalassiosira oceanica]|eukprot:EJK61703.1 hypothetical protein THAOC_17762 [Thalassiosira oceanica]
MSSASAMSFRMSPCPACIDARQRIEDDDPARPKPKQQHYQEETVAAEGARPLRFIIMVPLLTVARSHYDTPPRARPQKHHPHRAAPLFKVKAPPGRCNELAK